MGKNHLRDWGYESLIIVVFFFSDGITEVYGDERDVFSRENGFSPNGH